MINRLDERAAARARRCLLFAGLTDEQFSSVTEKGRALELGEGEFLFALGHPVTEFFMLDEGRVKLTRISTDGNEKVIDIIAPGQSFAEAAMFLHHQGYPVNAQAVSKSRVLCFDTDRYMALLRESPDACLALLGRLSQRLHWQVKEIDRLTLHSATYRLVNYLLEQLPEQPAGYTEVALTAPKHVIASRLSIKPETFSRILQRLTEHGLIRVESGHIALTDIDRVREYAQIELG